MWIKNMNVKKIKKCECKCEKNRKWEQNERYKHEHKKRNFNVDINNNNKELKNHQFFSFMQLTLSVYSINSQHTTVSEFCIVL